jgi:hypothetical protein
MYIVVHSSHNNRKVVSWAKILVLKKYQQNNKHFGVQLKSVNIKLSGMMCYNLK